jgi:hypothetical protein
VKRPLLTFERRHSEADVLVVTSGWPTEERATYCVFIERQMNSLVKLGLLCDVLFIRGYRSLLAYPVAMLRLAFWSLTGKRRYRLVHAHGRRGRTGRGLLPAGSPPRLLQG